MIGINAIALGEKTAEEQQLLWSENEYFYNSLFVDIKQSLSVFQYGGGWHRLSSQCQWEAKEALLNTLKVQMTPNVGSKARAYLMRPLLLAYYKKAKEGQALRKLVLTKVLEPLLVGWFQGDWLKLLEYLGEQPHSDEQITTALPELRLLVGADNRVAVVSKQTGVPAEEIQLMMESFWQQKGGASPIELRVPILLRYWREFEAAHARQSSGMVPLWGLVSEGRYLRVIDENTVPYHHGLYNELLPYDLLEQIEQLWGTTMIPRWPNGIATEIFPHTAMAETFGSALKFWHGCALTAWFLCEGPYSRTDMAGLAFYHRHELHELELVGTPIPEGLFDELIKAESSLGPSRPIYEDAQNAPTILGAITINVSISHGNRRAGFETLRDIITRYRNAWTKQYIDTYLRSRWESELREVAKEHALLLSQKGKAPTLKQFGKTAVRATNHWFGGDIGKLFTAIGEKSPCSLMYSRIMPTDINKFTKKVTELLELQLTHRYDIPSLAIWYIQLHEIFGRTPNLAEFGRSKLSWIVEQDKRDVDDVWKLLQHAISSAIDAN